MPAWADHVPDGARSHDVVDLAVGKAKSDAIRLSGVPIEEAASALEGAATQAARISVLVQPGRSAGVTDAFRATLRRVLPSLEAKHGRRAIGGALAFVNVLLAHGAHVDGYYDRTTRVGLEREVALLDAIAETGKHDRLLAFAALAAGRADLARLLSIEPSVRTLADALESASAAPFHDLVQGFHKSGINYAELMFVARAYVVGIEKLGPGGIGAAAQWLHRIVREGVPEARETPRSVAQPSPPPSPSPSPSGGAEGPNPLFVERARVLFGAGPAKRSGAALEWSTIALEDVHPLFGGRTITISRYGHVGTIDVAPTKSARKFRARLTSPGLAELDALLAKHDPRTIKIDDRQPVAGEGFSSITFSTDGATSTVGKWGNTPNADYDALLEWLRTASAALVATAQPEATGKWNAGFEPA